jgi:hypothetical protein
MTKTTAAARFVAAEKLTETTFAPTATLPPWHYQEERDVGLPEKPTDTGTIPASTPPTEHSAPWRYQEERDVEGGAS